MRLSRSGEIQDRFFERVQKDEGTGCWNWTGTPHPDGYGYIAGKLRGKRYVPPGQQMLAHRVSWMLHHGEIPEDGSYHGTVVMHKCDNRRCVNPDHLMLGTQAENNRDMGDKGRAVTPGFRAIRHPRACFDDWGTVEAIRGSALNGPTLAALYGVNKSTINRLRARKTYA